MDTKAKIGVIVADKEGRVLLVKEKVEKKPVEAVSQVIW